MENLQLRDFPQELIIRILELLDVPSLMRCCRLSREFRNLIRSEQLLSYCIELYAANMIDNVGVCRFALPVSQRLAALRKYTDTLGKSGYGVYKRKTIKLVADAPSNSVSLAPNRRCFFGGHFFGLVDADYRIGDTADHEFLHARLVVDDEGEEEEEESGGKWENNRVKLVRVPASGIRKITQYHVDGHRDLLILLEVPNWFLNPSNNDNLVKCSIHFRSLQNPSIPHPSASASTLSFTVECPTLTSISSISLQGNTVVASVAPHHRASHPRVLVYNWLTGTLLLHLKGNCLGCTLLDESHLLVVSCKSLLGDSLSQLSLQLYHINSSEASTSALAVPLASFQYPPFGHHVSWKLRCQVYNGSSAAFPSVPGVPEHSAPRGSERPFLPSNEFSAVVVRVFLMGQWSFLSAIYPQELLTLAYSGKGGGGSGGTSTREIPWGDWRRARALTTPLGCFPSLYVHANHLLLRDAGVDADDAEEGIKLFDFHPKGLLRANMGSAGDEDGRTQHSSSSSSSRNKHQHQWRMLGKLPWERDVHATAGWELYRQPNPFAGSGSGGHLRDDDVEDLAIADGMLATLTSRNEISLYAY